MEEVAFEAGVEITLDSLLNNRLTLLAGAGLSMASPSCLPSAAQLAANAKSKYDGMYGASRPPLAESIEDQTEYFFQRGELDNVYFRSLVDPHTFSGQPNAGHYAVADLLLVRALQKAVTTNVDTLIETAGELIYGFIGAGIDGHDVTALPPGLAPLLKIHGCHARDRANMVWARGQLSVNPVADRITISATWLNVNLLSCDLLVIGFSTDWDYLNEVLSDSLGAVSPTRVVIVNPLSIESFTESAPELIELGERATVSFSYVRESGDVFLEALRRGFSKSFIRRVLYSGSADYHAQKAHEPDPDWMEASENDNTILWQIRRDLEGCGRNQPSSEREPHPGESLVGLTLLELQAGGAIADGLYWKLNELRVRVVRTINIPLYRAKESFGRELPQITAPDLVIAVGAEGFPLPSSWARTNTEPTIVRGSKSRWMTRSEAKEELAL